MTLRHRVVSFLLRKESQARILTNIRQVGQPVTTPANFMGFTKEGYQKNAIVFKCVDLIASACAGIELELYQKKGKNRKEIEDDPLLDLLAKPNPLQSGPSFIYAVIAYLKLTGNSYIEKSKVGAEIRELWSIRPDLMKIIPDAKGYPGAYQFSVNGLVRQWPVNPINFDCNIAHLKTFHPNNDWYGMSPLEAAMLSLDSSNAANRWNLALLQNSATPSGVLQMKTSDSNPTGALTDEQFQRLKEEFYDAHVGSRNAGRPLLLEGGLQWQTISISPKDMEWIKGKEMSAMDICNIYGVPGEMLGLGEKTYANYQEARMSFYEETVLPTMDMLCSELDRSVSYYDQTGKCFAYDKDDIEALEPKRVAKYNSMKDVNFLMQNEKREACGFEPVDGMDIFVIGSQLVDPTEPLTPPTDPNNPGDPNAQDSSGQNPNPNEAGPTGNRPAKKPGSPQAPDQEADAKGWKSFGRISGNEKKQTWRAQNARRKRLITPFASELEMDLLALSKAISKAAAGKTDARHAESAMIKAASEHMVEIERTLKKWINRTTDDFGNMVLEEAKSVFPFHLEKKANVRFADFQKAYVEKRTAKSITEIEGTTKKQIVRITQRLVADAIDNGDSNPDLAGDLRDEFEGLSKGRARTIARTEVTMASSNAAREAVKSLQIPGIKKEWVSIQDDRTRDGDGPNPGHGANHLDMNGVKVDLDEKFTVPPDTDMEGPGDESGGADQVCNCRCVLTFSQSNSPDSLSED